MNPDERVIHSRRAGLLVQSIAIAAVGAFVGVVLQSWSLLRSSPLGKLAASTGLPVIALAVAGLGLWLAVTFVRDSWNHRVVFSRAGLSITDSLGSFAVPYSDLAMAKLIPTGGVVIAFRDPEQWLAQAGDAHGLRRRTSAVLRGAYGADILISRKQLAMDAAEFVTLLRERAPDLKNEGVQQS